MEKKIFRKDEQGNWGNYYKVEFPDGQIMDENNHDFERDGFFWSEEEPIEFSKWKDEEENNSYIVTN